MPESSAEVYARVTEAVGVGGRLPAPSSAEWDVFPWRSVDGAVVPKVLRPPEEERPRDGEQGGKPCPACAGFDPERTVWDDDLWVLTRSDRPSGMPLVLTLWTREHMDFGDLDDEQAAQFGKVSNRLVRIMQSLPNIGRVHVNRWGDGGSHLHVWFVARTEGLPDVRGSWAIEWDDILPPGPEDVWHRDLHVIATKMANWGGHAGE